MLRQLKSQYFDLVANSSKNSSHELEFLTWTPKYIYRQCMSFYNGISGTKHSEGYHISIFLEVKPNGRTIIVYYSRYNLYLIRR